MTSNFWTSTHYKRWIVDRSTIQQARSDDLRFLEDPELLDFFEIYFANAIAKLGSKLNLRQRVIATATIFFRRFFLKNSYCEMDPFLVVSACLYVAAKVEESPLHIKSVTTDSRSLFHHQYSHKTMTADNSKLAEMEFYLVDDLEGDLVVYHPYRTLLALCQKESNHASEAEAGEVAFWIKTEEPLIQASSKLELSDEAFEVAWSVINDTYRGTFCLRYPPHLIAIAAIYVTHVIHPATRDEVFSNLESASESAPPRRSTRTHGAQPKSMDALTFLTDLNVSLPVVATIAQEILALYATWDRYKGDVLPNASGRSSPGSKMSSQGGTPGTDISEGSLVTMSFLTDVLTRMRESRMKEAFQAQNARPMNKMLERTQAAG
ncbi:C/H/G cyclin [Cylindrobasidium torrendii FP15055 ss-10]|uniref:C/H/G cyclin n=1 Tax=Cylindrobasidium torrendii FP15055 ss-10 TaxID=1314674 RepID=A0A0D7BHI2_9AGAR|nr:C/H/G cyclin [Cylindrobasidium torrendii FP15055 ss-10]